jgi:hypothetical protein
MAGGPSPGNPDFGDDDDVDPLPSAPLQPETKLYAQFSGLASELPSERPIKNVQEAVAYGTKHLASSFQTHKVTSVTLHDGEVLTGQPKNVSGTHYLGVRKILTAADIIALHEAKAEEYRTKVEQDKAASASPDFNASARRRWSNNQDLLWRYEAGQDIYRAVPKSTPYINTIDDDGRMGNFVELNPIDMVYNKQGHQIWPQPAALAVTARPAASPRP